ncbi:GntR family transcriptional regulator [Streptomyces sp. NPDC017936]|uniref:GntR family transcriptional regulator n=1 Tax=Streptomyces sp. NPDC017936 TaxID=3365016 RepID=UPI00379CE1E6
MTYDLAAALSVAVRAEPALIRAVRLRAFPRLGVEAETDLWFSDLVRTRAPSGLVLRPQERPGLLRRLGDLLARAPAADPLHQVGDIVDEVHTHLSPALRLEEKLNWLTATGRTDELDAALRPALRSVVTENRTSVTEWFAAAWERLPQAVRDTPTAWKMAQLSRHLFTDSRALASFRVPPGVEDAVEPAHLVGDVHLGVRRRNGQIEIGDLAPSADARSVPVPDTHPRLLGVLDAEDNTVLELTLAEGGYATRPVPPGPLRLRTARGAVFQLPDAEADAERRHPFPHVFCGIGVDRYEDPQLSPLRVNQQLEALAEWWGSDRLGDRRFADVDPRRTDAPDHRSVRRVLDAMVRSPREARETTGYAGVIVVAAHGLTSPRGDHYIACRDTRTDALPTTALAVQELMEHLGRLSLRHCLVVLDVEASESTADPVADIAPGPVRRVVTSLLEGIGRGDLPVGGFLPPQRSLAQEYDVSRDTVQRALRTLVDRGILETRQGSGTRVIRAPSPDLVPPRDDGTNLVVLVPPSGVRAGELTRAVAEVLDDLTRGPSSSGADAGEPFLGIDFFVHQVRGKLGTEVHVLGETWAGPHFCLPNPRYDPRQWGSRRTEPTPDSLVPAVPFYRELVTNSDPGAYLPHLAGELVRSALRSARRGRLEEALQSLEEGIHHYRFLTEDTARTSPFPRAVLGRGHVRALAEYAKLLSGPELDRGDDALDALTEAIGVSRALAQDDPAGHLPDLADCLDLLALQQGRLGRAEEALQSTAEAVRIRRGLAEADPHGRLVGLAASLRTLAVQQGRLGRDDEALSAASEAVELQRELRRTQAVDPSALASSLQTLAVQYGRVGRVEDALQAVTEAVDLCRGQARLDLDDASSDLAESLHTWAVQLARLGRYGEGDAVVSEAVDLRRRLTAAGFEAHAAALAESLDLLAVHRGNRSRREDALEAAHEAVALRRDLARRNPRAHLPALAESLVNLAVQLDGAGRRETALQAVTEAVGLLREPAAHLPEAHLPQLAAGLRVLAGLLGSEGRYEEALTAATEALAAFRHLAARRPEAHLSGLAAALHVMAVQLHGLGRREEALTAVAEAVALRRQLSDARPTAHQGDVRASLRLREEIAATPPS